MRRRLVLSGLCGSLLAAAGVWYTPKHVAAQSGTRAPQSGTRAPQSGTRAERPHYAALWDWLQRVNYRTWTNIDGGPVDFEPGQSPHGALVKIYVSPQAASDPKQLPHPSVIVKENYSPDKKLMAITIMQRARGFDPEHADWYYAKYLPNGQIDRAPAEMNRMPIAGRFPMCIECHAGAQDGDYAFLNDR